MTELMDLLLGIEIPEPQTAEYKIKRLSRLCGKDVVFRIKQLGYNRVAELKKEGDDLAVQTLLAGLVDPDLKDHDTVEALKQKYSAATPAILLKQMLLPGEIEDLSAAIERLSGYRMNTLEEIKKK